MEKAILSEAEMRDVYEILIDKERDLIDGIKSCIERYGTVEECLGVFQACIPKECFESDADDYIVGINNLFKGYKVPFSIDTNNVYKITTSGEEVVICFDTCLYGSPLPKYW